jgi:hypothetical protein
MRVERDFVGALAIVLWLGCSKSGGELSSASAVQVDAVHGDDLAGDGSAARPFRTITHALAKVRPYETVQVSPGTYDVALGETFPLVVPASVDLSGDPAAKGAGSPEIRVAGAGTWSSAQLGQDVQAAIVTSPGASVEGLAVAAAGGAAVWCEHVGTAAKVRANTLSGSGTGIAVVGTTYVEVALNEVSGNGDGLATIGPATPRVRENLFTGNQVGVFIGAGSQPDLGTALDPGQNELHGNSDCDLENRSSGTVDALGNVWDADPLSFVATTSCAAGVNVANTSSGAVLFQEIPAIDAPLFGGAALLTVTSPSPGTVISTTQPRLAWQRTGARYAMVVLATEELRVRDRTIDNPGAMIWAWHTGLGRGSEGDVLYVEGVPVVDGLIQPSGTAAPLARGRVYYWAAWAWDDSGQHIDRSTALSWFIVSN